MTIKDLFLKNRKQFFKYIFGAFLTIFNSLAFTFALSMAFSIIEANDTSTIINRLFLMILFAFSPILLQMLSRFLRIGFMRDVLIQVRCLAYEKIMNLSIEEYRSQAKENYMALVVSDINVFEKDFFLSILNIVFSFGSFVVGIIIMFFISPLIALSTVFASSLLFIVTRVYEKPTRNIKKKTQEANAEYTIQLSNILNGLEVIKLYQVESNFISPFYAIVSKLEEIKKTAFRIDEFQFNINAWIATSFQTLVYIYATYLFIQDKLSLSSLIIVFNLIGQLIWGMINGFSFINRFTAARDIFNRITKTDIKNEASYPFIFKESINLKNLSFNYGEKNILNNMNFNINVGDKILMTGPSGVGKTTLLDCLSKNLSSYQGEILVDGIELKDINRDDFLKHTGYVRQNHFMFNDSIKYNIILNMDYNEEKFKQCLIDSALYDWVETLELKENHILEQDGTNISGGQRQRISIARELYHDRDILFVDEPSASLDDQTSLKIYDTLLNLDKTIICVSHRHIDYLSSRFNKIIALEKGVNR